jgi:peptide/nickel transport system ATP-binding protein
MQENSLLLEVKDLRTYFYLEHGTVYAVDGVSFDIRRGRTLGVLGESGCGKSVTALSVLRLIRPPGKILDGQILYHRTLETGDGGEGATETLDLLDLDPNGQEIRRIRGAEIAMVFQEPMTFMNPVYTAGEQIMEAIVLHQEVSRREARERAISMLARVGMPQPDQTIDSYPHQLSGGMRQRALIAAALSCNPNLLIADEPTTALDVTTEAQILELMKRLQRDMGMSLMYITHDLGVIAEMADEVIVVYLGQVMEQAPVRTLFHDAKHPYTQALLRSVPKLGQKSRKRLDAITGMVPDPTNVPTGCTFHPRCAQAVAGLCDRERPQLTRVGDDHHVRCLLVSDGSVS